MKRPLRLERRGPRGYIATLITVAGLGFLLGLMASNVGSCAARVMGIQ